MPGSPARAPGIRHKAGSDGRPGSAAAAPRSAASCTIPHLRIALRAADRSAACGSGRSTSAAAAHEWMCSSSARSAITMFLMMNLTMMNLTMMKLTNSLVLKQKYLNYSFSIHNHSMNFEHLNLHPALELSLHILKKHFSS